MSPIIIFFHHQRSVKLKAFFFIFHINIAQKIENVNGKKWSFINYLANIK